MKDERLSHLKIAGLVRIADFPFNPVMALNFAKYVDHLVVPFDGTGGYNAPFVGSIQRGTVDYPNVRLVNYVGGEVWHKLFETIDPWPEHCTVDQWLSDQPFHGGHWLEEMIRRLDDVRPDIVVECEADAAMEWGGPWEDDLLRFWESDKEILLTRTKTMCPGIDKNNMCDDGRYVPEFPVCEHCRAYKWKEGITYHGGKGFCVPVYPNSDSGDPVHPTAMRAKTRMLHYPIFTEDLQEQRWAFYGKGKVDEIMVSDKADADIGRPGMAGSGTHAIWDNVSKPWPEYE